MKFPFYKQYDSLDCGPACLAMVSEFYGKKVSQKTFRELCAINNEGVNLLGISQAATTVGYACYSTIISFEELSSAQLPAILHWDQRHFVVLYKIKRDRCYIADPAKGKIILTKDEFSGHWVTHRKGETPKGIAFFMEPSTGFTTKEYQNDKAKTNNPEVKNIWGYIKRHRKPLFIILLTLIASGILQYLLPYITRLIVDKGISQADVHFLVMVAIAQACVVCGRLIFDYIRGMLLLKMGNIINISILTDFLNKLLKLPLAFFDSQTKGSILQRMNDHQRIESFITGSSLSILFSVLSFIVFSIVLLTYNAIIFIVFISATLLYAGWIALLTARRKRLDYQLFDVSAKKQNVTIQLLEGINEIKLFGMENYMTAMWKKLQGLVFAINRKLFRLNTWQQTGSVLINETKNIIIIFLAATLVMNDQITLGTMMAIQMIIGQLSSPVEQFITFYQSWQTARISMNRLNDIHSLKNEDHSNNDTIPRMATMVAIDKKSLNGKPVINSAESFSSLLQSDLKAIVFDRVGFTYPGAGNQPVLKDLSLEIPFGKTTAIVGMSGSGKTTLLKLLLRYYEPQSGIIQVGDSLLSDMNHRHWRSQCGVVMQDNYIFPDTIARNIGLGADTINDEKLRKACAVANIDEFIEKLPLGYDTFLGPEGHGMSTGQKQRLLIARAVYKSPEFIFFDEATNSLDTHNERIIQANLQDFFLHKTVVIVAHRLSTVRHADQIVVLKQGILEEKGDHEDLIMRRGYYYELVRNQLELG